MQQSAQAAPDQHLLCTVLSLALIKPIIKRKLQQEVGILELEDFAGGVVSYRLMQFATISPDLSSCHLSAALGKSGRRSTCGGCREARALQRSTCANF
jgi:hypothetical protein